MNAQRKHKRDIPSKLIFDLILLGEIWELMSPLFLLGKALESPITKSSFYYQWLTKVLDHVVIDANGLID
jgi:hypothetical protein